MPENTDETVFPGIFLQLHRILPVKAGPAKGQFPGHGGEIFYFHIAQRIGSDHLTDFLCGMSICQQLVVGRYVRSEIAGVQKRRGTDPHMNLSGACLLQQTNQIRDRSSPDDRVVDEDNVFPFTALSRTFSFSRTLDSRSLWVGLIKVLPT